MFFEAVIMSAFDCRGVAINKTTISLIETPVCESKPQLRPSTIEAIAVTQTTTVSEVSLIRYKDVDQQSIHGITAVFTLRFLRSQGMNVLP